MKKRRHAGYFYDDRSALKRFYDRYEGWIAGVSTAAVFSVGVYLFSTADDANPYQMYEKEKTFKEEIKDFLKNVEEVLSGKSRRPYGANTHNEFLKAHEELTAAGKVSVSETAKPVLKA